jgi:hypothetical protein
MESNDWISSGIALGALLVAILALIVSVKSANAAEDSAEASKESASTAGRQHELDLARDGIVEFGPWRAESATDSLEWQFINLGDEPLFGLGLSGGRYRWQVGSTNEGVPPLEATRVKMAAGAQGPASHRATVVWRVGSDDAPEVEQVVWLRRRQRR